MTLEDEPPKSDSVQYVTGEELISHTSEKSSKSFKLGFSRMWTEKFQMYKLGLEKAEKPEIKLPALVGS